MYVHLSIVTPSFAARVNGGESFGNISTLQVLQFDGQNHSVVSASAIRLGIRRLNEHHGFRRTYDPTTDSYNEGVNFDPKVNWDDDLLGYMKAGKGDATAKRRGRVEVTPGISLDPYYGDSLVRSSAGERDSLSYGQIEAHYTAYQFTVSIDVDGLTEKSRAKQLIESLSGLHHVGGSRSRFQSEFRPESIVIRVTDDPCPWVLNAYTRDKNSIAVPSKILNLVQVEDLNPSELIIGGVATSTETGKALSSSGVACLGGVKQALAKASSCIIL